MVEKEEKNEENERTRESARRKKKDAADFLCVPMLTMYVSELH